MDEQVSICDISMQWDYIIIIFLISLSVEHAGS